jgi:hypothetical protein
VREVITAVPNRLALGRVSAGTTVVKRLLLASDAGNIRVVSTRCEGLSATAVMEPGSRSDCYLLVTWLAPSTPGIYSGELRVECDQPEMMTLGIPLSGIVAEPANADSR